jgi:hypothetical protein
MANTQSKIEKLGLAREVNTLVTSGINSGKEIGRRLRTDGHKISDSAVNRYLNKVGRQAKDQAADIIKDHVDRVVPEDLDALESMEDQCLKWANEDPKEAGDRLAGARLAVDGMFDHWVDMLRPPADDAAREKAIKSIVSQCMRYVLTDARLQGKRIQAMTTAIKIIDLKLSKAGLLTEDGRGRIIIYDKSHEYKPSDGKLDPDAGRETFKVHLVDGGPSK